MFGFWKSFHTHLYLFYIHLVCSIIMFVFDNKIYVRIFNNDKFITNVNLFNFNGAFLLITSLAHLIYAFVPNASVLYRWIEYGISAPIMMMIIAMLSGITQILTLVAIFGLISSTMIFGNLQDYHITETRVHPVIAPFWKGFIPYMFAWSIVFYSFFDLLSEGSNIPQVIYPVIHITFFFFTSFAGVQYYCTIVKHDLDLQDRLMIFLSMFSKLTLSFWVMGGIVGRQVRENL